jgi:RHS repeat-associated protein
MLRNNFKEAAEHFRRSKAESPDWRHRTYASNWIRQLSRYKRHQLAMLNCGVLALAALLDGDGKTAEADQVRRMRPVSRQGHSIKDLASIAADYGYELSGRHVSVNELDEIPLPAIVQINGRNAADRGHYWMLEKKSEKGSLTLFDPQSNRTFHQEVDEFASEWEGVVIVFSDSETLPGIKLADNELGDIYGGCCGAQRPTAGLGNPGSGEACGSPRWMVNVINLNLFVSDTPLWYSPPFGPSVEITLSYNSQSAIVYNEPFGNKWQFNYGSYLMVDTGGSVIVVMPDGRRDMYMPDGTGDYVRPYQVFNTLTKIAENHFELRFPDDTVYVYDIPPSTSSLQPFLVEIRDAYGQSLTLDYDANVQLTTVTDATGKVTTVSYNVDGLVTQVADPFGRFAAFEYDTNRNLTKITDMGGYWSAFSYDNDIYIIGMGNSQSQWQFKIEPADGVPENSDIYPPPDDTMWENYRITITDPLANKQEYFYYGGCDGFTCSGYTWHVSPRDYIPWQSPEINNFNSDTPKTRYFFTQTASGQRGEISKILYPEGGYVEFGYDSSGNITQRTDSHGHTTQYNYNNMGLITSSTDPKGNVINVGYAQNGVDLIRIQDGLGTINVTYNGFHDVTSITDRLGNTTAFTYNGFGQLLSQTNALGIVTDYIYAVDQQLQEFRRAGQIQGSTTYDAAGRVTTYTDATGLTLTFDYNDLNNITKATYPDTKFDSFTYSICCPNLLESVTDRSGRTTRFVYDDLKQLIEIVNPEGGINKAEYDANGNIIKLVDANGNITVFLYDLNNRLVKKVYADGKETSFDYDGDDLLTKRINARGATSSYTYDENHNLLSITHSDGTPGVSFQYDNYNRITQMQDGIGTTHYTYDTNSRILSIDGPWASDTVTYQYDPLGRRTVLSPQGGQNVSYTYDALNRLTSILIGGNAFTYIYSGASPIVQSLTRPNGSVTTFQFDNLNRVTEISNKNASSQIINQYVYGYNQQDLRSSETIVNGNPITSFQNQLITYDYGELNQLLSSTNPAKTFIYDDDGNLTQGYTPDGFVFAATYDAENRLTSIQYDNGGVTHSTEYSYSGNDFLSRKIERENGVMVSDIRFIRDAFLSLQERNENNNISREYVWGLNMGGGIGGLLNLRQGGHDYSYLYDAKGNVTALLDLTQTVIQAYTYDTFGTLMSMAGIFDQPFQFSTKRFEEKTGLSYFGYRFYSAALGRWMTRDPIEEIGGINLYEFALSNPVGFIDPMGLSPATPSAPVPTPYPNVSTDTGGTCGGGGQSGVPGVKLAGTDIASKTDISRSSGDMPSRGTGGGLISARNMDKGKPQRAWSYGPSVNISNNALGITGGPSVSLP